MGADKSGITRRPRNKRRPYTVRYRDASGKQREPSFATWREAKDFKTKIDYDQRSGIFTDPRLGTVPFTEYAKTVIDGMAVSPGTMKAYRGMLTKWLAPWAGDRTLAKVAQDREGAARLVNQDMAGLSFNRRAIARGLLTAILDEAVAAGRIDRHKLAGIRISRGDETVDDSHDDFVFPSYADTRKLADMLNGYGLAVWLMRGCGLRIREALAVHKSDFRDRGTVLRVSGQASTDGTRKVPLKHRRAGQFRDVPVPAWLWNMVKSLPDGPVCPRPGESPYWSYDTVYGAFCRARDAIGIPKGYTPHSCRHAYATALLTKGAQLHEVSQWLGHVNTATTAKVYAHVLPSSVSRAREILDDDYRAWRGDT